VTLELNKLKDGGLDPAAVEECEKRIREGWGSTRDGLSSSWRSTLKKRRRIDPTQRTLRELRARGIKAAVVEKWNRFASRGISLESGRTCSNHRHPGLGSAEGSHRYPGMLAGSWQKHLEKLLVERAQDTTIGFPPLGHPGTLGLAKVKIRRGGRDALAGESEEIKSPSGGEDDTTLARESDVILQPARPYKHGRNSSFPM